MDYRKDIQILRGISVLLVVLYHLDLAWFKSGFLGVDVFFVISGFLMAALYTPDRIRDFFSKRAKRLLPAYFVTILVTLVLATVFVSPYEYGSVTQQALFGTFFLSNIGFWLENSYFSKVAFSPLLHLWSLGVEIQFYALLPALAWAFKKIKFSYFAALLGSLLLCFFVLEKSDKTAFFMMPLRLWEFLIGYGIAKRFSKPVVDSTSPRRWLGMLFLLALLCIPLIPVNGRAESFLNGHPGLFALFVCLMTAGLLTVGLPPQIEALPIATALESLGKYSYSIYLVHFPVIVLFLYQPFSGTVLGASNWVQALALVVLIVVLSLLMHFLVENRFRINGKAYQLSAVCAVLVWVLSPAGMTIQKLKYAEKEWFIYQSWADRAEYRCGNLRRMADPSAITCNLTDQLASPRYRILLVGDSHSDSIKHTFASAAAAQNVEVRFMVDNDPLLDGGLSVDELLEEATKRKSNALIVHYSPDNIEVETIRKLVEKASGQGLPVSFILPVPTWKQSVPQLLWKQMKFGEPLPGQTLADYQTSYQSLAASLGQIADPHFRVYPVAELFCTPNCTLTDPAGHPLYFDPTHLTLSGSELLRPLFEQVITDLANK